MKESFVIDLFDRISQEQGWRVDTQVGLLISFINKYGDKKVFAEYLREIVKFENLSCSEKDGR